MIVMQQTYNCEIIQCKKISSDIYLIILGAPENQPFDYQPGQYLYVDMAKDDSRPYSIASIPGDGQWLHMHLKDVPGNDFTGQVLEKLQNSSHINIRLADGRCTIDRSNGINPLLFIAGGTGFAHSHSIIQALLSSDDSRAISLYWGANSKSEFYLQEKINLWATEHPNFTYIPVISGTEDDWAGERGMVHEAVFRNIDQLVDYDIFLSGSSAMVFNIYRQLRDKKVPSNQIFSDMLDILREKESQD